MPQATPLELSFTQVERLWVLYPIKDRHRGAIQWCCLCECGNKIFAVASNLKTARTKSCGCLQEEKRVAQGNANRTHGHCKGKKETSLYNAWAAMRKRCTHPTHKSYADYGGRGITICARWDRFENFLEDMGERPTPQHSLDRINNEGNYEPGNCRWATKKQQANNRRPATV